MGLCQSCCGSRKEGGEGEERRFGGRHGQGGAGGRGEGGCINKCGEGDLTARLLADSGPASSAPAPKLERGDSFHEPDAGAATLQASKMTGQALLQVAQNVPLLAPVAYLLGAVASSAAEAVVLKSDCREFGVVIQQLEQILLRAERIEQHGGEVDEVREALADALALMEAMKRQGYLKSFWVADSQRSKFEDIRERIARALQRLTLASSVDTNAITRAKFKQSEDLRICVQVT